MKSHKILIIKTYAQMTSKINNPNQDSRLPSGFFTVEEAQPFANSSCNCLPKAIMHRWFWLGFQAMQKAGLTYYETNHEEIKVRHRINMMNLVFYEYCHITGVSEYDFFMLWEQEFLMDLFKDLYNEDISILYKALIGYFETPENLEKEMWTISQEGEYNLLIPRYKTELKFDFDEDLRNRGYQWILDGFSHISNFECMQSFDHDYALKNL